MSAKIYSIGAGRTNESSGLGRYIFASDFVFIAIREGLDLEHLTGSKVASPRGFEPRLPP